ncbi:hypothetical protein V8G54_035368 [Vigna mungo]|uniref:Uncharacterized protein n=1 Tax=Vigna mungo TaxID=3915 RepID=A0AAQ3MF57_VIGMU
MNFSSSSKNMLSPRRHCDLNKRICSIQKPQAPEQRTHISRVGRLNRYSQSRGNLECHTRKRPTIPSGRKSSTLQYMLPKTSNGNNISCLRRCHNFQPLTHHQIQRFQLSLLYMLLHRFSFQRIIQRRKHKNSLPRIQNPTKNPSKSQKTLIGITLPFVTIAIANLPPLSGHHLNRQSKHLRHESHTRNLIPTVTHFHCLPHHFRLLHHALLHHIPNDLPFRNQPRYPKRLCRNRVRQTPNHHRQNRVRQRKPPAHNSLQHDLHILILQLARWHRQTKRSNNLLHQPLVPFQRPLINLPQGFQYKLNKHRFLISTSTFLPHNHLRLRVKIPRSPQRSQQRIHTCTKLGRVYLRKLTNPKSPTV